MKRTDLKLLIVGVKNNKHLVFKHGDWKRPVPLMTINPQDLLNSITSPEYFPDFDEHNALPKGIENNHIELKKYHSRKPRVSITFVYRNNKGVTSYLTSRTPQEFLEHWAQITLLEKCSIIEIYAMRKQMIKDWIYHLENLDLTCLDWQLHALNNTGWNCDWEKQENGTFTHNQTRHTVLF